jgi:hypothetical protein
VVNVLKRFVEIFFRANIKKLGFKKPEQKICSIGNIGRISKLKKAEDSCTHFSNLNGEWIYMISLGGMPLRFASGRAFRCKSSFPFTIQSNCGLSAAIAHAGV